MAAADWQNSSNKVSQAFAASIAKTPTAVLRPQESSTVSTDRGVAFELNASWQAGPRCKAHQATWLVCWEEKKIKNKQKEKARKSKEREGNETELHETK